MLTYKKAKDKRKFKNMKKVVIIGSGFAGLSAAYRLSKRKRDIELTVIDKKQHSDFLPLLPDCLGRGINPDLLRFNIADLAKDKGFTFIVDEVVRLDLGGRKVLARSREYAYDYLIIASGSETNFYGNVNIQNHAYKLDDTDDVVKIDTVVQSNRYNTFVVAGGGYTGIEVATNIRLFMKKNKVNARIIIVERAQGMLGPLPQWMKDFVADNLKRLGIDLLVDSGIERIEGDKVFVARGKLFEKCVVIWAAGVKTSQFIQDLDLEKNPQGRLKVDEYLRINDNCFVAGDATLVKSGDIFLRMAVQFAITQGEKAAENVIRTILAKPLRKYRPVDLGYIIPMANNHSCGIVLGFNFKGYLPTWMHFFMCIFRLRGVRNKAGLISGLFKKGVKDE
jgi:NADH dehydrogenase